MYNTFIIWHYVEINTLDAFVYRLNSNNNIKFATEIQPNKGLLLLSINIIKEVYAIKYLDPPPHTCIQICKQKTMYNQHFND